MGDRRATNYAGVVICIGFIDQTVEQQFDKGLLAKVNKIDGEFNKILAGKSGNDIVSILVKAEENNPGSIRFCNDLPPLKQHHFQRENLVVLTLAPTWYQPGC